MARIVTEIGTKPLKDWDESYIQNVLLRLAQNIHNDQLQFKGHRVASINYLADSDINGDHAIQVISTTD